MKVQNRLIFSGIAGAVLAFAATFTNPLLPSGADPWVTFRGGFYYYTNTTGRNLTLWKTRDITDLKDAEKKVVWTPPQSGPDSHDIWAPELHRIGDRWYIYFAADAGKNDSHRIWVVENPSEDPLAGEWTLKGKVSDATDKWAIDATVFENAGTEYMVWSGWPDDKDGEQDIYIARLKNPWTVAGPRVRLSAPQYPWEKVGDLPGPRHVNVNEGPEILKHAGRIFLTYSASGCWTNNYELGLMVASEKSDPMKASSWRKLAEPVFTSSPEAHAFGTGHNGFFQSPDGKQDWIIYHANPEPNQGCGGHRSPRMQPFTWKSDGMPDFGRPVPAGEPLQKPSGLN
jgi:GH43 family beta-xylosidase